MCYSAVPNQKQSRGFLLLVVMGLLSLLLVLCIGFLSAVRSQTNAVVHQRDRVDLINMAFSGMDYTCAQISSRIFDSNDRVDPSKYVSNTVTGNANALSWYKEYAVDQLTLDFWSGNWEGLSAAIPKKETKWVYLPKDYLLEGGLRARFAIQVSDTNAYTSLNDSLEDGNPSHAQQAHIIQGAIGFINAYWVGEPVSNLFKYNHMWNVATNTHRSVGLGNAPPSWPANSGFDTNPKTYISNAKETLIVSHQQTLNTTYFNSDGADAVLAGSIARYNLPTQANLMRPIYACRANTDPDTGRSALNVNTCLNSGQMLRDTYSNWGKPDTQSDIEATFNIGSLRRIIKVGSFYSTSGGTNASLVVYGHPVCTPTASNVPIVKYLDPYLYPGNQCFDFDPITRQVKRDADGKPLLKAGVNVGIGLADPATIGTLDSSTGLITAAPGRIAAQGWAPRDPATAGTVDPYTVSIDPIDGKMSYAVTPNPNATGFDPAIKAAYDAIPGSVGRPYVYKSHEDLLAALTTEDKCNVEKLKTKLALQYQETLTRYFVASYNNHNNGAYPSTSTTVNNTYASTYSYWLGGGGDGVAYAAQKFDYTQPRFPYSLDDFRKHVKDDLIVMTTNNNNKVPWGYTSTNKDGTEYVNFDAGNRPEICAGKLDKRTASAIFDNICPGKRLLFPTETNIEIKDPIGQLYKRRVGIDEEAINWIDRTPPPKAPTQSFWTPNMNGTMTEVGKSGRINNPRMRNPYGYDVWTEDNNENGVLDSFGEDVNGNGVLDAGEDIGDGVLSPKEDTNNNNILNVGEDKNGNGVLDLKEDTNTNGILDFGEEKGNGVLNSTTVEDVYHAGPPIIPANNGIMDKFETFAHIDNLRERGQEVWCADPTNPVHGRDFLSTTGYNRFVDENIYFNTASNPIHLASPAAFDQTRPNCLIHPLPQLTGVALPLVTVKETANPNTIYVQDSNGYWSVTTTSGLQSDFGNGLVDWGEDANHNGKCDMGEDTNNDHNFSSEDVGNGILDPGEDLNSNGILNRENVGNGILDPGEDLNGNGVLDVGEDIPDGLYSVAKDIIRVNGVLDGEDIGNGTLDDSEDIGNGKFDTIEYIPGSLTLDPPVDLNGDGIINTYYRTPERMLAFSSDCFSHELTTTSVSYKMIVTVELCDTASVDRNPAAPIIVAHNEICATVQLAPDIEGADTKQNASDYTKADGSSDKANDPGLHYYRTNQPTIRKTRTYESDGSITTCNTKTGVKESYDPVKEVLGLQIRGGIMDNGLQGITDPTQSKLANEYTSEQTSSARQWIDAAGVPDSSRDAYYRDPYQNKRRIVIRDLINYGANY